MIRLTFLLLVICALTGTVFADSLPASAAGVAVDASAGGYLYPAGGDGGGFSGTVAGLPTTLWCVDEKNYINLDGHHFDANVIPLGDSRWWTTGGYSNYVLKAQPAATFADSSLLTPLQRYQAAAWLISQYSGFPAGPNSGSGANNQIQYAIWDLTALQSQGAHDAAPALNSYYTSAVSFISNPMHNHYGFGEFATVTSVVDEAGVLSGAPQQTLMVQMTPEPAQFVPFIAAAGLAALLRKRKKA